MTLTAALTLLTTWLDCGNGVIRIISNVAPWVSYGPYPNHGIKATQSAFPYHLAFLALYFCRYLNVNAIDRMRRCEGVAMIAALSQGLLLWWSQWCEPLLCHGMRANLRGTTRNVPATQSHDRRSIQFACNFNTIWFQCDSLHICVK